MNEDARKTRPELVIVAAMEQNRVIGCNGQLPWRLPEDLARFKAMTLGKAVVMGRKTWDSLPANRRPLPGRRNYVLTRQAGWTAPGALRVTSLNDVLEMERSADEVFVIGGSEVYALALPLAGRMELTEVEANVEGDAVFPAYDANQWELVHGTRGQPGTLADGRAVGCSYVTLRRR